MARLKTPVHTQPQAWELAPVRRGRATERIHAAASRLSLACPGRTGKRRRRDCAAAAELKGVFIWESKHALRLAAESSSADRRYADPSSNQCACRSRAVKRRKQISTSGPAAHARGSRRPGRVAVARVRTAPSISISVSQTQSRSRPRSTRRFRRPPVVRPRYPHQPMPSHLLVGVASRLSRPRTTLPKHGNPPFSHGAD
jgi:hypothetical protein